MFAWLVSKLSFAKNRAHNYVDSVLSFFLILKWEKFEMRWSEVDQYQGQMNFLVEIVIFLPFCWVQSKETSEIVVFLTNSLAATGGSLFVIICSMQIFNKFGNWFSLSRDSLCHVHQQTDSWVYSNPTYRNTYRIGFQDDLAHNEVRFNFRLIFGSIGFPAKSSF